MPWLRAGDNAATHPIVMRVASFVMRARDEVPERDIAVNEVFGFTVRCALESAGHTTDYLIEEGTAWMIGGPRTDRLIELAKRAGYLSQQKVAGRTVYRLVDDPEFLHMRLKAEIDWEKQQRADSSNPALTVPVRRRDGDACRYCAKVVNFRARKGKLAGTYDHRTAGQPAKTPDDLVVACGACNAGRRDYDDADERYPLLPAPTDPYYTDSTAAFLASHGVTVTPSSITLRPGAPAPGTAHQRPATADNAHPATRHGGQRAQRPATADNAHQDDHAAPRSADPADRLPTESGFAGSGRDGTGRVSSRSSPPRSQRSRRGARGRPRTGDGPQ